MPIPTVLKLTSITLCDDPKKEADKAISWFFDMKACENENSKLRILTIDDRGFVSFDVTFCLIGDKENRVCVLRMLFSSSSHPDLYRYDYFNVGYPFLVKEVSRLLRTDSREI